MGRSPLGPAPLIYAHRGDRSRAPDNTIEAFALAEEAGADGIEIDVRSTADGVLVLLHDPAVEGLPPVSMMTFDELREAAPQVPTLIEVLAAVPSTVFLNVEIKNHQFEPGHDPSGSLARSAVAAVVEHDDPARVLFSSFDAATVGHTIDADVGAMHGLLHDVGLPVEDGIVLAHTIGVAALHPPFDALRDDPSGYTDMAHDAGLAVVAWDVNTEEDVALAVEAGVDVIITDDPRMARRIVEQA